MSSFHRTENKRLLTPRVPVEPAQTKGLSDPHRCPSGMGRSPAWHDHSAIGTGVLQNRFSRVDFFEELEMAEHLPVLMEDSIQIAWDYLERTGEIEDAAVASRFLSDAIELMVRRGERRRLLLSNKAIMAYTRFKKQRTEQAA
jgi:hypothetical protein